MKAAFYSLVLVLAITLQSCIGSFNAFNGLKDWNMEVTDEKWINEAIFVGLNIIPVYGLFMLGDMLIFNAVEFWSGENPISMSDDDCEEQWVNHDGKSYRITANKNQYVIEQFDDNGQVVDKGVLRYKPKSQTWKAKKGAKEMDVVKVLPKPLNEEQGDLVLLPGTPEEVTFIESQYDLAK